MNINDILMSTSKTEKPLDNIVSDGGYFKIFRDVACIGDSLSSGEFESLDENNVKGYHDFYDYSWGQYMAREAGCKVYNFSRGGMSAKEYCNSFADSINAWDVGKKCRCYILALGVNDITSMMNNNLEFGNISDIDMINWRNNKETFAGYYGQIIQRYKEIQPKGKFFLVNIPNRPDADEERVKYCNFHSDLMKELVKIFDNTYVIDLRKYAPAYDDEFRRKFFLGGHMNAMGYIFTAKIIMSYIDYIIRQNPEDFLQTPFIGTPYHNSKAKW